MPPTSRYAANRERTSSGRLVHQKGNCSVGNCMSLASRPMPLFLVQQSQMPVFVSLVPAMQGQSQSAYRPPSLAWQSASCSVSRAALGVPCPNRRPWLSPSLAPVRPGQPCSCFLPFQSPKIRITHRSMSRFALDLRKLRLLGPSPKRYTSSCGQHHLHGLPLPILRALVRLDLVAHHQRTNILVRRHVGSAPCRINPNVLRNVRAVGAAQR